MVGEDRSCEEGYSQWRVKPGCFGEGNFEGDTWGGRLVRSCRKPDATAGVVSVWLILNIDQVCSIGSSELVYVLRNE